MKNAHGAVKLELRETHKILVVDDNATDQQTIKHMLALGVDANYRVTTMDSIPEAKKSLAPPKKKSI